MAEMFRNFHKNLIFQRYNHMTLPRNDAQAKLSNGQPDKLSQDLNQICSHVELLLLMQPMDSEFCFYPRYREEIL